MRSEGASAAIDASRVDDEARRAPPRLRPLLRLLSPAGRRGKLTTLIFHRVRPEPDALFPNEVDAAAFHERLRWIREWFNVLPLEDAVAALARGSLPERALAITFDDGYADNYDAALPILREHGLPATFFVATAFLDGGRMWNDTVIEAIRRASGSPLDLSLLGLGVHALGSIEARRRTIDALLARLKYLAPDERLARAEAIASSAGGRLAGDLMMTSEQVRALAAAGMGIGGHTMTHPILARSDAPTARREIADGRDALEAIIRQPVRLFAYPNGKPGADYAAEHVEMVRGLGFAAAVSTSPGAARAGSSAFELPRFTPWEASAGIWGYRLARNLLTSPRTIAS
ncbi:MAG TPA: polysaccharide deacetylase family protein [Casimicrobiaceae bacterium]